MSRARNAVPWAVVALAMLPGVVFGENAVEPKQPASSGPVSITFLTAKQAKQAIVDDKLDPYFSRLQPMEMSAKTGRPITGKTLPEQRAECRRRYQAEVREFRNDEKETLTGFVKQLLPALKKDYPRFGKMPWSFLKVSDRIEGGLPHTRGGHIVLSQGGCDRLTQVAKLAPRGAILYAGNLLLHEQMHVFQRMEPRVLDGLYTKAWGLIRAKSIRGGPWLTRHHLVNPDAPDCSWVFPIKNGQTTAYIWPLVVLREGEGLKRMPDDFRMIAVELDTTPDGFRVKPDQDGRPAFRSLLRVREYTKRFSLTRNIYHPREASADVFARLVLFDSLIGQAEVRHPIRRKNEKALAPLRRWFRENLKKAPAPPAKDPTAGRRKARQN